MPDPVKRCTRCGVDKPLDGFPIDRRRPSGLHPWCRTCVAERSRARLASSEVAREKKRQSTRRWRANNPERAREHHRSGHLRRKFGMTPAEHAAMLDAQGNRCALCGSPDPRSPTGWHTDHDHETGKVRGIVCQHCNHLLGRIEAGWMLPTAEQVALYLERVDAVAH